MTPHGLGTAVIIAGLLAAVWCLVTTLRRRAVGIGELAAMAAVEALCRDILSRRRIPSYRIVGHSDIAPDRKSDPGELFDWPRLARAGIGLWPPPDPGLARGRGRGVGVVMRSSALADLARIGYCVTAAVERAAIAAFQRRFRPERWDGLLDAETCYRLREVRMAIDTAQAAEQQRRRTRFN